MIIGLDVGGTHTDVVLLGSTGLIREIKVITDPDDLFSSVLSGLENIMKGIKAEDISRAVLSTTLTTNAIVSKKHQPVGMIISSGPGIDPEFFRTNQYYYAVSGSIDHRGREQKPVNESEIISIAEKLKKEGIRNIGIVSKFCVRNPEHELKIHEMLKKDFGKIFMGHKISGNLNFPRRIATTYLNAAIRPIHKQFFEAVKKSLEKKGLDIPIHILKADGGTMNFDSALDFPAQTILSGPAASVMGSLPFASRNEDIMVLDIGGTTTDMAVLIDGAPVLEPSGITIGKYKALIRSLKTRSIGIGGDSLVRVENNGKLLIGPERVGPAMAYGGKSPTPTDALCVLGSIKNGDLKKAETGMTEIGEKLGISTEKAAMKVFNLACRTIVEKAMAMIDQINSKPVYTVHELQEGYKVDPKRFLILGGPALWFAEHIDSCADFKFKAVAIPNWQVANAIGAALARTTCEVTLFADTEQGIAKAPEENFHAYVDKEFSSQKAVEQAFELLKQKAVKIGSDDSDPETEVIESQQFNMVRGFYTTGRNIRVKVQVKPGLIHEYEAIAAALENAN